MSLCSKSESEVKKWVSGQKVDLRSKMGLKSKIGSLVKKWVSGQKVGQVKKSESGQEVKKQVKG